MNPILANAGVPMIFITLPPMVVLIIPVVVIEFLVARKAIVTATQPRRWIGITSANLVSTFIGWPVAWIILACLGSVNNSQICGIKTPRKRVLEPLHFILATSFGSGVRKAQASHLRGQPLIFHEMRRFHKKDNSCGCMMFLSSIKGWPRWQGEL